MVILEITYPYRSYGVEPAAMWCYLGRYGRNSPTGPRHFYYFVEVTPDLDKLKEYLQAADRDRFIRSGGRKGIGW